MKRFFVYSLITAVALFNSGCKKTFEETNVNPNSQTNAFPNTSYLLSNVLNTISNAGTTTGGYTIFNTETALYVQYLSLSQYPEPSLYSTTTASWDAWYAGPLEDLYTIIRYNTDGAFSADAKVTANGSNNNQKAIARILKAYLFSIVTDRWGDVPYSEALTGAITPKYDRQQAIYTDMFKELREAIAQFDGGAKATGDQMFGGDAAKWKKFANSLRMVLALRLSKVDATTGKAEFAAAYADAAGYISTNADNAAYKYQNNINFSSPWNSLNNGRDDYSVSDVMINYLKNNSDPRLAVYAQPNASGQYVGIPYGLNRSALTAFTGSTDFSRIGLKITGWRFNGSTPTLVNYNGQDGIFISASQMWFTKAEAEQKGWIGATTDASTSYQQGVKLSWDEWGLTYTTTQLNTYIAQVNITPTTNLAAKIGQQKWIALFPKAQEAWFEWRRTGYPALIPTPYAVNTSKQIPRRYGYPDTEIQLNAANYRTAVTSMGGDTPDIRVWWDKP